MKYLLFLLFIPSLVFGGGLGTEDTAAAGAVLSIADVVVGTAFTCTATEQIDSARVYGLCWAAADSSRVVISRHDDSSVLACSTPRLITAKSTVDTLFFHFAPGTTVKEDSSYYLSWWGNAAGLYRIGIVTSTLDTAEEYDFAYQGDCLTDVDFDAGGVANKAVCIYVYTSAPSADQGQIIMIQNE